MSILVVGVVVKCSQSNPTFGNGSKINKLSRRPSINA